jgi:hypothetical protein
LPGDREQLEYPGVANAVEDARSLTPACEQALFAKGAEVLGRAARVQPKIGLELTDRPLSFPEEPEDAHARRMPEHAKKFSFERVDGVVGWDQECSAHGWFSPASLSDSAFSQFS